MANISDNSIKNKLTSFDVSADYLTNSGLLSRSCGLLAKSVVRMPAIIGLHIAMNSGGPVSENLVDAAVECVENFTSSQIASSAMPDFIKSWKRVQNMQCGESIKLVMKNILKSEGRLV